MFNKMTTLTCTMALVISVHSAAQANPHNARYRQLDEIAFAAFVDARALRWEIHDDFVESHEYEHLLQDANEIIVAMQDLQVSIYREVPELMLARSLQNVQRKLSNLTEHLNGCDFARVSRSRHRPTSSGRGYVFTPETQHVGRVHVDAALRMIARIELNLSRLNRELASNRHSPLPTSPSRFTPVGPVQGPVLHPRGTGSNHPRSVTLPVSDSKSSKFILQFGF